MPARCSTFGLSETYSTVSLHKQQRTLFLKTLTFTDAAIVVIEASFWLVEVVFDRADIVGDVQFH